MYRVGNEKRKDGVSMKTYVYNNERDLALAPNERGEDRSKRLPSRFARVNVDVDYRFQLIQTRKRIEKQRRFERLREYRSSVLTNTASKKETVQSARSFRSDAHALAGRVYHQFSYRLCIDWRPFLALASTRATLLAEKGFQRRVMSMVTFGTCPTFPK